MFRDLILLFLYEKHRHFYNYRGSAIAAITLVWTESTTAYPQSWVTDWHSKVENNVIWNQAGSGSAFPELSPVNPPRMLPFPQGGLFVDLRIDPPLCLCLAHLFALKVVLHFVPPHFMWIWTPKGILSTYAHSPSLIACDTLILLLKIKGKMGRRKKRIENFL